MVCHIFKLIPSHRLSYESSWLKFDFRVYLSIDNQISSYSTWITKCSTRFRKLYWLQNQTSAENFFSKKFRTPIFLKAGAMKISSFEWYFNQSKHSFAIQTVVILICSLVQGQNSLCTGFLVDRRTKVCSCKKKKFLVLG